MEQPESGKLRRCAAALLRMLALAAGLGLACISLSLPAAPDDGALDEFNAAVRMRDMDKAVAILVPLAESGNPEAQYQLAALHRSGRGVPRNHKTAFDWLLKAAKQEHAQAQYNLGVMYENGWGTGTSYENALHWFNRAASNGHKMAKKKILAAKSEPQPVASETRDELLRHAIIKSDHIKVRQALAAGADIDARDDYNNTPLMQAAEIGNAKVIKVLLADTRLLDAQNNGGESALHIATKHAHGDIVKLLLKNKASVNLLDRNGESAAMIAAGKDDARILDTLIAHGARLDIKNRDGLTAADIAARKNHRKILALLAKHNATPKASVKQTTASAGKLLSLLDKEQDTNGSSGTPPLLEAASRGQECDRP